MMTASKNRALSCHFCHKEFEASSKLAIHIRSHTQEKPFQCDRCDRRFSVESNLKRHQRTVHTIDRRYSCTICGKTFNQKCNVKRHSVVHKLEAAEKPKLDLQISIPKPVEIIVPKALRLYPDQQLVWNVPMIAPNYESFYYYPQMPQSPYCHQSGMVPAGIIPFRSCALSR